MKKLLSPFLIIVLFLKYGDLCMLRSNNYFLFNSTNSSFNHLHSDNNPNITRSFSIDYEKDTFVKNSEPFQFISATFNLYNVPHELWRDRLNTFWAVGLNTIQIHVLWDQHEPYPGVYEFEDEKNISRLLSLAQEFGFNVILRTGALTDNDGLPWWISEKESDYQVNKAKEWFNALLPRIVPFLYKNGGPIIVVQHEILYDVYFSCDNTYVNEIKEIFNKTLGDDVVYFAKVESPFDVNAFGPMCNQTRDVYPVSGADLTDTNEMVQNQRSYSAHGPLVNTDFNIGWTDSWGKPPFRFDLAATVERFLESQSLKANINLKGFFGGTNFGFRKDADKTTCSDHDSAISESGDITHKFLVLRVSIARFFQVSAAPVLKSSLKHSFGMVDMKYYVPLVDVILSTSSKCVKSDTLPTFESLGQGYGVILYSTDLSQFDLNNTVLSVSGIKGRAYVQIGYKSFGVINSRDEKNITLDISLRNETNQNLFIVVENLDNYNQYDVNANSSNIKLEANVSINGEVLKNWNSCITDNFIPNFRKKLSDQKSVDLVSKYAISDNLLSQKNLSSIDFSIPGVYIGEFNGSDVDYDTFLRMDNFERGFALIQSNESVTNLGQYWPHVGPQVTLYTPSVFLAKSSKNHVILFELEKSIGCQSSLTCNVEFIDHAITN